MVGDSALTAAQRSVLSEHRTEEEARNAAEAERRRLEVVRPDDARAWRLQVLRDGQLLHEERPHPEDVPPVLGRPPGRGAEPAAQAAEAADAPPEPAGGPTAAGAGGAGTAEAPVGLDAEAPGGGDEAGERGPESAAEEEPPPEGPVPDWVIRRFEEAVERERRRGGHGADPDGA